MMNDQLPPIDLAAIENFIGYGIAAAPVVFVGIEERLSHFDERIAGLTVRANFHPIMDVEQAHAAGLPHNPRLFNPENPISQPTWRPMCDLLIRLGHGVLPENLLERRHALLQYQANHLGRIAGTSLLAELLPLPHGSTTDWWYNDFYPALHTRAEYEAFMIPPRAMLLGQQLALHPRDLIVCYGKSHFAGYHALIAQYRAALHLPPGQIDWEEIPLVNPDTGRQWSVTGTIIGGTSVILANHLTRMPLSSNWGLEALADALGF